MPYNAGMSLAEGAPLFLAPADPEFREARRRDAKSGRIRRGAIVAAALAHAAAIVALVAHWPALFPVAPPLPQPIPVTLVTAPPSPPRSKPAPRPPPALTHDLMSGPDEKTTAPQQASQRGAVAAPKPAPPTLKKQAAPAPPVPMPKPVPVPALHRPAPQRSARATAPRRNRDSVVLNRAPGEKKQEGDPYLNRLRDLVEAHRIYPANAVGSLGLRLEGVGTYLVTIGSGGALEGVKVERSAGAPVLDRTALKMIEAAAPFPPLPAYYPHPFVVIQVVIPIYPAG